MIKKINAKFFTALLVVITLSACNKNGTELNSDLSIAFQTKVNGENFKPTDVYTNAAGVDIQMENFQFYLSDITLINSDDERRLLSEIELFRFDATGASAMAFKAPNGNYTSIEFGVGVKQELNEADPSNYSEEGHPLNTLENNYWGWAAMYRFITYEGRFDVDNDGVYDGGFAYHTGREASYRTVTLAHEFEIKKKDANSIAYNIDLYQLLERVGNEVDVTTEPFYHGSTSNEDVSTRISDNMAVSISIAE